MTLSIALFLGVVVPLGLSFILKNWGWTRLQVACQMASLIMVAVNLAYSALFLETGNIAGIFVSLSLLMLYFAGSSVYRGQVWRQEGRISREDHPFEFWFQVATLAAMGIIGLVIAGLIVFLLRGLVETLRNGG